VSPAVILILIGTVEASLLMVFEGLGVSLVAIDTSEGGLAGGIVFDGVLAAKPQEVSKLISPSTNMNAWLFSRH